MISETVTPEVGVPAWFVDAVSRHVMQEDPLARAEAAYHEGALVSTLAQLDGWNAFRRTLLDTWTVHDHVVIRGLPAAGHGTALLCAASALGCRFRTYRRGKIVKHFRMSPWTAALSHTLQEGHFHTDLNTDPLPPRVTAIQCIEPDPAAPAFGQVHVARLSDLLSRLEAMNALDALDFLRADQVTMVNDTSPRAWTGTIVDGQEIRFHPETIRAAERRAGRNGTRYDAVLATIKQAALDVSLPIDLAAGDLLLISNARALHYRSACTVRFIRQPTEFASRRICVAHLIEEPE